MGGMETPSEEAAVEKVVDRLAARFPSVDPEHVEEIVDAEVHELDGARVRDYVPVLVEHQAMDRLREEADPVPLAEMSGAPESSNQDEDRVEGGALRDPYEQETPTGGAGPLIGGLGNS